MVPCRRILFSYESPGEVLDARLWTLWQQVWRCRRLGFSHFVVRDGGGLASALAFLLVLRERRWQALLGSIPYRSCLAHAGANRTIRVLKLGSRIAVVRDLQVEALMLFHV